MITRRIGLILLALMAFILASCGADDSEPLPTLAILGAEDTATAQAALPTPTNTRPGPTLPPTWTPQPSNTPSPSTNTPEPTPTREEVVVRPGMIYYVYNEDAIIALEPETGFEEIVQTFGVDVPITGLTAAPDGSLLAFVAPGAGSAREVFVATPDGSYLQQVSCLGFGEVLAPAWSADSASLAFIGAQATDQPRGLYVANVAGSGNCPADNGQRLVYQSQNTVLSEVVWDPFGERLFFSEINLFAVDLATGVASEALTSTLGFGNPFDLAFDPANLSQLTYIRPEQPPQPDITAGVPFRLDVSDVAAAPVPQPLPATFSTGFDWRDDGSGMVIAGVDTVLVYTVERGSARAVVDGLNSVPQVVYRPDGAFFAYTDVDTNGVPQVFLWNVAERTSQQLTNHTEGTIRDMVWIQ